MNSLAAWTAPEAIASCFRIIANAPLDKRVAWFERQAADALSYALKAGIEKVHIIDRLDEIAAGFDWPPDERQRLLAEAIRAGSAPPTERTPTTTSSETDNAKDADIRPLEFSDDTIALRVVEQHADHQRWVDQWGRWYIFDGVRWEPDQTLLAFDRVREICREVANECTKSKIASSIVSAKTVSAAERLAKSDRRIAATPDQWDTDLLLLNTPRGVIDLRTGQNRRHSADDYMTKVTGVAPDAGCPIHTWLGFLTRIMNGDTELIAFLQRMAGYALTGLTREHALFFLYGTGANGKSTFLNALIGCFGDYHRTSGIETFTASTTERHPTDLAGLRGARLVTAVETEEGRRWAESKIKSATGGDTIAARFMRQDYFQFTPAFKLVIAGNHKPGLRSVDEAIRRRFHLVPFTMTIPPNERDETLSDQLKAEWPGILAWAIDGCLEWQRIGLAPPAAVQAATEEYLEAEDALAAWIEESGERDANTWESSTALFRSWKNYADRAGEYVGSLKKFSQRIEDRSAAIGMRKARDAQGRRGFYGLRVTKPDLAGEGGDAGQ